MTDLPSSLGIEAVECVAEGGPSLTVRVSGRWRRRRPELRGQPMLVVETEAGRQRFMAMPEPPSLTGAAPGTWRMSFSVPAALAPALSGRTFLQLGGVMVSLPIGEVTVAEAPEPPSPDLLEARRARSSELAAESARRRAAELAGEVERLEAELSVARAQSDRLRDELAARERRLRGAEQHAHAERALRADLEQELAGRTRSAQHDLSVLHGRVAELERELTRLRRAVDEAGHAAAAAEAARVAAEAAREAAERRLAERPRPVSPEPESESESDPEPESESDPEPAPAPPAADDARAALTRRERELDLAARRPRTPARPAHPAERPADRGLLRIEAGMVRPRAERADPRLAELERELAAAREDVAVQRRRSARAYEAIALVRAELAQLRAEPPPAAAPAPPAATLPTPPVPPAPRPDPTGAGPIQAEHLAEALARLRERTPPVDPAQTQEPSVDPVRAAKPWLNAAFRRLAAEDASAAGRLVLALLPAQRAADPQPVAYDLVLSDVLVAHVTSDSLGIHVDHDATTRPPSELDFQLVGDLASLARLLRSGRLRRRLRIPPGRMARVRGDRRRVAAIDRLIGAQLTLRELHATGVRLDPVLAFTLASVMIEPGWTAGERFTIGHRDPATTTPDAYLHIRDGRPPLASAEPPHGPVASTLVCTEDDLLGILARPDPEGTGEERPVTLLRQWLDRAQCG